MCLSCICLLAMHTLICVTFSLPPGVGVGCGLCLWFYLDFFVYLFLFVPHKISKVYMHGQGLRACKIAAGSIIKQASYEALKCVSNIAWFYRSHQRVAFLTFTERPFPLAVVARSLQGH